MDEKNQTAEEDFRKKIREEMKKNRGNHSDFPEPEKIKEILDVVSEKIPTLLKDLSGILYSPGQAKQFGVSVATFYKELKDAGMTDEQAYELTTQYMSTLNLGNMMKGFNVGQHTHHEHH